MRKYHCVETINIFSTSESYKISFLKIIDTKAGTHFSKAPTGGNINIVLHQDGVIMLDTNLKEDKLKLREEEKVTRNALILFSVR